MEVLTGIFFNQLEKKKKKSWNLNILNAIQSPSSAVSPFNTGQYAKQSENERLFAKVEGSLKKVFIWPQNRIIDSYGYAGPQKQVYAQSCWRKSPFYNITALSSVGLKDF